MELEKFSALELGKLVNKKEVSPREVISYFFDRIQVRNPSLNAFTYLKFEDAIYEALHQEQCILRGESPGPFAGVPIGLKDFLDSKKGWTNSHGGVNALVREDVADSEFYKAARSLGAIAIGKTNAPAFGFSGACQNVMYGSTRNPFVMNRTSGGSSGGSAAAVADGLLGLAEGGDAGGSIRIPAGWCNLFGYKSSLGTVPSLCRPDAWSATHPYCFNGGLTRTVLDSAILMSRMARYDPRDPISLPLNDDFDFTSCERSGIRGLCIGYTTDFDLFPEVDEEVKNVVEFAVHRLERLGAVVEPVKFHWKHSLDEIVFCWAWSISVDTALDLEHWKEQGLDLVKDYRYQLPEEFIFFNEVASKATIKDFRRFNEIRTDILDNFEDAFQDHQLIISPTAVCKPIPIEDNGRCKSVNGVPMNPDLNFINFAETMLVNFIGYPAASVPAGFTSDGCPTGMQIIGRQYHDADVFTAAFESERVNPWEYSRAYNRFGGSK